MVSINYKSERNLFRIWNTIELLKLYLKETSRNKINNRVEDAWKSREFISNAIIFIHPIETHGLKTG